MARRAVPVIEAADVPRDVGDASLLVVREHEARHRGFDLVAPDLLRRAEHRGGNQREERALQRGELDVLAVDEEQVGVAQRRQRRAIVDAPVALRGPFADDCGRRAGRGAWSRRRAAGRRRARSVRGSAGGGPPRSRDRAPRRVVVQPPQVRGHGEGNVLLAQQPEEPAIGRGVARGQQQHATGVPLADVEILVPCVPVGTPASRPAGPLRSFWSIVPTTATAGGPPCAMFWYRRSWISACGTCA